MARTLNEFVSSTGNYVYEITDAEMAGVDLTDFNVAVLLHCVLSDESEKDFIVFSKGNIDQVFDISTQYLLYSPTYCRNIGNGIFIVSLPFWRMQHVAESENSDIVSAEFEVVIYGFNTLEYPNGEDKGAASFQCIVIDTGTINFTKNRFPLPLTSVVDEPAEKQLNPQQSEIPNLKRIF
jgi:hypothetical protein